MLAPRPRLHMRGDQETCTVIYQLLSPTALLTACRYVAQKVVLLLPQVLEISI